MAEEKRIRSEKQEEVPGGMSMEEAIRREEAVFEREANLNEAIRKKYGDKVFHDYMIIRDEIDRFKRQLKGTEDPEKPQIANLLDMDSIERFYKQSKFKKNPFILGLMKELRKYIRPVAVAQEEKDIAAENKRMEAFFENERKVAAEKLRREQPLGISKTEQAIQLGKIRQGTAAVPSRVISFPAPGVASERAKRKLAGIFSFPRTAEAAEEEAPKGFGFRVPVK
jgi:hypothetical protein